MVIIVGMLMLFLGWFIGAMYAHKAGYHEIYMGISSLIFFCALGLSVIVVVRADAILAAVGGGS